jgi:hypothetical protein
MSKMHGQTNTKCTGGVSPVPEGHTAEVLVTKYHELHGNPVELFTEVRHCIHRVVNCICIVRFEVLRAVLMEDVLLSACLFVGKWSSTFRRSLLPRNIAVYRSPRLCATEDFSLDLSSSYDVSVALLNIQNSPLS